MFLRNLALFFAPILVGLGLAAQSALSKPSSSTPAPVAVLEATASPGAPQDLGEAPSWTRLCGPHASEDLDALVEEVSEDTGIDPALLAAVMFKESTCRPEAIGGSGEIGLTQVHPRVWTRYLKKQGLIETSQDLLDPEVNLRCSAHILGGHLEKTDGDIWKSLRRYNGAGPEARRYADRVFATYLVLSGGA